MRDRYPISGIKQSYRTVPESRTIVMPILIVLLLGGMTAFFFLGKSPPEKEPEGVTSTEPPADETSTSAETNSLEKTTEASASIDLPDLAILGESGRPVEKMHRPAHSDFSPREFTEWMSPLALDSYIKKKNEGFSESFWKRGHWITAVEGRWTNGSHEFRISFEKIPSLHTWQWQYRVNQTPEEFSRTALELRKQGYELVQSQSFDHPDQQRRFQGVWQKEIASPTVAETSPHPAWERRGRQADLDRIPIAPVVESAPKDRPAATSGSVPPSSVPQESSSPSAIAPTPPQKPKRVIVGPKVFNVNQLNFR